MPFSYELPPKHIIDSLGPDAMGYVDLDGTQTDLQARQGYIMDALAALNYPQNYDTFPLGVSILRETRRMIDETELRVPSNLGPQFSLRQALDWQQGIFELTLAWAHEGATARIFEIGILADPYGNLVIKLVQKHRLDMEFRADLRGWNVQDLEFEKKAANHILTKHIKKSTGMLPEAFGFLATVALFGPHAKEGCVYFPTPESHWEIATRYDEMKELKRSDGWKNPQSQIHLIYQKHVDAINRILPLVDFATMLNTIDVQVHEEREGYQYAFVADIRRGFPNIVRHGKGIDLDRYPHLLSTIHEAQART